MKLMVDYGCEVPLWHASWWELSLSPSLLDALADWQQGFDEGFRPEKGWRSDHAAAAWADAGERLVVRLRYELDASIALEIDLWPLEPAS